MALSSVEATLNCSVAGSEGGGGRADDLPGGPGQEVHHLELRHLRTGLRQNQVRKHSNHRQLLVEVNSGRTVLKSNK